MDEKDLIGQKGMVDTEAERSILEYRPKVKYEPNKPFTVNIQTEETTVPDSESPGLASDESVPLEKPAAQYLMFAELGDRLTRIARELEEKLKDVSFSLTDKEINRIFESSPGYVLELDSDGNIPFETYKKTFDDPEEPGNSLLQDYVHSYAEDVDGSLELELYEDVREMQYGIEEGYFLFKESILKRYVKEIPASPANDEGFIKQVDDKAIKISQVRQNLFEVNEASEKEYYESLRTEYGSPEFFKVSEKYKEAKRPYDLSVRDEKTEKEMMSLIDGLLIAVDDCAGLVKSGLVLGSGIEEEEVMKVLVNQAATKEKLNELLKLTQLSLKLQVNQQIQDKRQYRDVLKNINNLSRKKRAHDELLMAYELRNKMYLSMYDTLQHLESPSKKPGVEAFLDQMAGGLNLIQNQYETFLQDVYLMYMSEYEIRKEKLERTLEKENARAGYSLVLEHL
ncbi:hypothetical protein [Cytobacillus oceanisediminis]|uniref:hypothetical protein n=1 Tax=Cytobacillus oceanisediminis TaxID=665099 RepID=UPI001FB1AA23|nr:hypothetical protein [Cytobacillus oceanisediminis]UOE58095.1 hypothetical protein IRB79_26640 [Cytobacillus oceanisediminis]